MRYAKAAAVFGVIAVAVAAAFFYHQSGIRGEQVKSLNVENQIGQAVIEQQVKNQEANHKAASNYEAKRAHIEASKVKAQRELKEVFDEAAKRGAVDDDRLTDVLLNYQDSLRSGSGK